MAYRQKDYTYNNSLSKEENILLDRLYKLKLSHMAEELERQLLNPNTELENFHTRISSIINYEWDQRQTKKFNRLKNKATLKSEYQKDMQTYYNAEVKNLDFNSSSTLKTINGWAQEKTNNMIPTILDRIDPDVVTYLLNAIYFKANWNKKFDPNNTKTETFTTPNGTKQLPLMHQNVLINYMKNETYSSVLIPYDNSYWSIMVYLPEKGKTADDIINTFNPSNDIKAMSPCQVDLKLPRFETNSDTQNMKDGLIGLLEKMGIRRVFDSELAEIPNMCNTSVFISMMRQKAGIKVNEEGTETAVVTLGSGYASWAGPGGYEILKADFHANCPFVYVIRERSSNVILSVGKYTGM